MTRDDHRRHRHYDRDRYYVRTTNDNGDTAHDRGVAPYRKDSLDDDTARLLSSSTTAPFVRWPCPLDVDSAPACALRFLRDRHGAPAESLRHVATQRQWTVPLPCDSARSRGACPCTGRRSPSR